MDKLESLKESDCTQYHFYFSGVQCQIFVSLLKAVLDGTFTIDYSKRVPSIHDTPMSYYRLAAWTILHLIDLPNV